MCGAHIYIWIEGEAGLRLDFSFHPHMFFSFDPKHYLFGGYFFRWLCVIIWGEGQEVKDREGNWSYLLSSSVLCVV